MARRLRARAVPVPAGDPARLPHGRGPGHQGLPASPPRPDQDEAPDRLVVDPAAARLRGPAAQAMIRIAVIGAGQWGPNLIRNFHNRRTSEVAWVVDRDAGRLAQVRERFPDIRVDTDAETVMADGRIDAVVIATPTSTHHALAKRALGVGKHVLVEKPITADSAEAEELCSLAAQAGRILMVGHVFVYNPGVQHVKQLLAAGELGRVYYVSMVRTNLGPIRVDVNAAWDLASHDVSIANHWLGTAPLTASAVGGSWINAGIEDAVFATLRYPNDVLVNLHISWLSPRKTREITLVGDRRMLTFDDMNLSEPVRVYDKRVTEVRTSAPYIDSFASFRASLREGDITIPKIALGEPLKAECDHFLECIAGGKRPLTAGPEALTVVRALEAIQRSIRGAGHEEPV
ncbi:MAG: Gfo/Idh/MocA family oxidoreductase [Deltaproteobacteria bacterium]|nr:MAG: Gfo/Idh/MocA family oxidoreductase [Deltaproteobacteria bacterium]